MRLLLDTQILIWLITADPRLRPAMLEAILDENAELYVSSVVAYEYADLQVRRRIPVDEPMDILAERYLIEIQGFPTDCWRTAADLPHIHRDPVDRMLVAHALAADMTLITADRDIRRYPVRTIW